MSGTRRRSQGLKVKWNQDDLSRAFKLVEDGTAIREAARTCGIPFSTLQERLKHKNCESPSLGRNPVFTREQEAEMADQVKFLGKIFYGCTSIQIRKMAYEYAVKNNVKHNFNEDLGMAGKDWIKGFMKRNNLSVRKAEGTSLNKDALIEKEVRKATREKKKEKKFNPKTTVGKKTAIKRSAKSAIRKVKKRVLQDKSHQFSSDSEIDMVDMCDDDEDIDVDDQENKCILCGDYGQNNELWYRCVKCGGWAHSECTGFESPKDYICDLCR